MVSLVREVSHLNTGVERTEIQWRSLGKGRMRVRNNGNEEGTTGNGSLGR